MSMNKVMLIGFLGADPEVRHMSNGNSVVNMRLATSQSWTDSTTGERRERTEWHRIAIFQKNLVEIAQKYFKKGDNILVEGALQTNSYQKDGQTFYSTDIVLQGFDCKLRNFTPKDKNASSTETAGAGAGAMENSGSDLSSGMEDLSDIPF